MAKKKIVQKVKTPAGYDIINPLTPWQVQHCSFAPTSTASLYKISTMTPPENLGNECVALFRPTVTNSANVQIEVNGVNFGPIRWNGADLPVGSIPANQYVLLYVDFVSEATQLQDSSGLLKEHINNAVVHIIPATIVYAANSFNVAAAIPPSQTRATLLGYTTQPYTDGDTMTINGVAVTLTDLTGEPLSDGAWGNGEGLSVPVQLMIDLSGATKRAFFKAGGLDAKWNIFTGTVPPDKPDGLFAQTDIVPSRVEFTQLANSEGSWRADLAPMPTARYYLAAASVGAVLYVAGGVATDRTNKMEAYDTISNLWSTKADMSTARDSAAAASVGTVVYVAGGYATSVSSRVEAYDTISNLWSTKPNMPTARQYLGAASVGTVVYVAGGYASAATSKMEAYDTISNLWSTKANMSVAFERASAASVGAVVYVLDGPSYNKLEAYDTISNLWSTKPNMPTARQSVAAASVGTILYAVGGSFTNKLEAYDTISNLWSTKPNMPTARRFAPAVSVGAVVYVPGGQQQTPLTAISNLDAYTVNGDPYPADTLVVEYGYTNKLARLQQGKLVDLVLAIKNAYIHDGTKLSLVPSKVNLDGQGWQDVI